MGALILRMRSVKTVSMVFVSVRTNLFNLTFIRVLLTEDLAKTYKSVLILIWKVISSVAVFVLRSITKFFELGLLVYLLFICLLLGAAYVLEFTILSGQNRYLCATNFMLKFFAAVSSVQSVYKLSAALTGGAPTYSTDTRQRILLNSSVILTTVVWHNDSSGSYSRVWIWLIAYGFLSVTAVGLGFSAYCLGKLVKAIYTFYVPYDNSSDLEAIRFNFGYFCDGKFAWSKKLEVYQWAYRLAIRDHRPFPSSTYLLELPNIHFWWCAYWSVATARTTPIDWRPVFTMFFVGGVFTLGLYLALHLLEFVDIYGQSTGLFSKTVHAGINRIGSWISCRVLPVVKSVLKSPWFYRSACIIGVTFIGSCPDCWIYTYFAMDYRLADVLFRETGFGRWGGWTLEQKLSRLAEIYNTFLPFYTDMRPTTLMLVLSAALWCSTDVELDVVVWFLRYVPWSAGNEWRGFYQLRTGISLQTYIDKHVGWFFGPNTNSCIESVLHGIDRLNNCGISVVLKDHNGRFTRFIEAGGPGTDLLSKAKLLEDGVYAFDSPVSLSRRRVLMKGVQKVCGY